MIFFGLLGKKINFIKETSSARFGKFPFVKVSPRKKSLGLLESYKLLTNYYGLVKNPCNLKDFLYFSRLKP